MKPWQMTRVFLSTQTLAVAECARARRAAMACAATALRTLAEHFSGADSSALWAARSACRGVSASLWVCGFAAAVGSVWQRNSCLAFPNAALIAQIAPESMARAAEEG